MFETNGAVIWCISNTSTVEFGVLSVLHAAGGLHLLLFLGSLLLMPCSCNAGCLLGCFRVCFF